MRVGFSTLNLGACQPLKPAFAKKRQDNPAPNPAPAACEGPDCDKDKQIEALKRQYNVALSVAAFQGLQYKNLVKELQSQKN